MDGAGLEVNGNLETLPKQNEELSVLQAIIDNGSCDVGTQTINKLSSNSRVTQCTPPTCKHNQGKNISNGSSNRSKRSSFRLLIVPDDGQAPDSNAFHDAGLRLSFDKKRHESNDQSLYFSVTSNRRNEVTKTTESFYDSKNIKKNKISKNTFKQNERTKKDTASFVSVEKSYSDEPMRSIDNQLMHSTNPSVLAWLKLKNFEEREKRRVKKHEKKELRRHACEEFEKKQKRVEESEKQFAQWLIAKKKEARRAWREKRAKKRVDTVENEDTLRKDNDPPPNYTVVPTFKGAQAWTGGEEVPPNDGKTLHALQKTNNPGQPSAESNLLDQASLDKDNGKNYNKKPTTAHSRNSKLSKRSLQEKWPKQERNCSKRPSTSDGRLTSSKESMVQKEIKGITHETRMLQKQEEKLRRPTTAHASRLNCEDDQKPTKKSITFKEWNAQKRQESKEKAKLKKREIVDDTLTKAIINMARKRVENSYKERRQLDTGMPKWQARNRVRASGAEKNASISSTSHSKYAVTQLLGNEQDIFKTQEADTQTKKVSAVRKSCENLKLH